MSVLYNITRSEESSGASIIFTDGEVNTIDSKHPQWAQILGVLTVDPIDEAALRALVNPSLTVGSALTRLSERVIFDNDVIYFDGDAIDDSISKVLVKILKEGGTTDAYGNLVAFLEKLYTNPSEKSRAALYDFLVRYDITILPDGDFIVYKGVTSEGLSFHSGYGIVDGKVFKNSQLMNKVGSTVEIPRSMVDADNARGCSTGLHAGSYEYASTFGRGKLLTVKVNPRDVVSVPDHCEFQKIRAARYVVLAQTDQKLPTITRSFTSNTKWADDRIKEVTSEEISVFVETVKQGISDEGSINLNFDYVTLHNDSKFVENFEVTEIVSQWGDALITGVNTEGKYRSYKFSRMSDVVFLENIDTTVAPEPYDPTDFVEVQSPVETKLANSKASHPSSALAAEEKINFEVIKLAIDSGSALAFTYVDTQGLSSKVEGFSPESVGVKNGGVLVTGTNSAAEYRSFKASRISELSVEQAPVVIDKWAAATFAALQEDNS